jgi:hypothetical protein
MGDGWVPSLTPELASSLVSLSIGCVDRQYPNKPGHILDGDETVRPPRELTPAFFGCFDWHSAVHGHWVMVRVLRLFPELPENAAILDLLNAHLSNETLQQELAFFQMPRNATFERPYGWGWLLRLTGELAQCDRAECSVWKGNLMPLAEFLSTQTQSYLTRLSVPVRAGTHASTAYSLVHALEYARVVGDSDLEESVVQASRRFYLADRDCPVSYEPSGEDFVSPCLVEADLMRRVLPGDEYLSWLRGFLPGLFLDTPFPLAMLPEIRDPEDPRIGHLIGLAFQRAASALSVAKALGPGDPARHRLVALARSHGDFAMQLIDSSGYGGEHWLATFAVVYLSDL